MASGHVSAARAQAVLPSGFSDRRVVSGLNFPPCMALLADGRRILVTEKWDARVRLVVDSTLVAAPVAVIDSVRQTSESGLLGVAVDPGWPGRPYVYLQYDYLGSSNIRIARYTAVGDLAFAATGEFTLDLASRYLVLADLPDLYMNHNGGTLRFGADGMLYSSVGDDQNNCNAVLVTELQGKILRLDVSRLPDGPGGPPDKSLITPAGNPFVSNPDPRAGLVWEYGLRNPFSFQIDPPTGDLFIADPGDATWEELDWAPAPGMNFGWPTFEGPRRTGAPCAIQDSVTAVAPIYTYDRTAFLNGAAVITAPRYRRPGSGAGRFPAAYDGDLFVSDAGEGFLRRLQFDGSRWNLAPPVAGQPADSDWARNMDGVTDYAIGPDGGLWYLKYTEGYHSFTGEIHRIVADPALDVVPGVGNPGRFEAPRPSPAHDRVTLAWSLARPAPVSVVIRDLAGRQVCRLVEAEFQSAGPHQRAWNGRDDRGRQVAPGIYLATLDADTRRMVRRIVMLR